MKPCSEPAESPAILTFLAPADRCNQRCPECIIDALDEPVRERFLDPADYGRFVEAFVNVGTPLLAISFQGYEVTLPQSWPYVEAVFAVAKRHGVRRSFITNGMLLDRYADRIADLGVHRVSVSLDGADEATNDVIRGLPGAFRATTRSIGRFLDRAPGYGARMSVVSTVYSEANFASLLGMPAVLKRLGIPRWTLGFALTVENGTARFARPRSQLVEWARALAEVAIAAGVRVHLNDEFGFFRGAEDALLPLRVSHLFDPDRILRLDPAGFVRVGTETYRPRDSASDCRWNPNRENPVKLVDRYRDQLRAVATGS